MHSWQYVHMCYKKTSCLIHGIIFEYVYSFSDIQDYDAHRVALDMVHRYFPKGLFCREKWKLIIFYFGKRLIASPQITVKKWENTFLTSSCHMVSVWISKGDHAKMQ